MLRIGYFIGAVVCFIAAAALILFVGLPERAEFTGYLNEQGQRVAPEIGALAPSFSLASFDGRQISLNDLRGVPIVVNFWATWCGPCVQEMPQLEQVYEEYQRDGLRILAVNMGETRAEVVRWAGEYDLTYDLLLDEDQAVREAYQVFGPPSTYVISPEGVITHIFYGPITAGQLERVIAPLLG